MTFRQIRVSGTERREMENLLLQRARLAHNTAGVWEAADVQWWSRKLRRSDDVGSIFWFDEQGPVAGVLLTAWAGDTWWCDPVIVSNAGVDIEDVWNQSLRLVNEYAPAKVEVAVDDNDIVMRELAERHGFSAGDGDSTAWMCAEDKPAALPLPDGFSLTSRAERLDTDHHMIDRNGLDIGARLEGCSLYDSSLDLLIEAPDGRVAGHSLYWFDPVTKVGLVEPVRVEDEFQRRGLAKAMLTVGIDKLVKYGAERIKVSYETEAAGALYNGVGFKQASTTTWYRKPTG